MVYIGIVEKNNYRQLFSSLPGLKCWKEVNYHYFISSLSSLYLYIYNFFFFLEKVCTLMSAKFLFNWHIYACIYSTNKVMLLMMMMMIIIILCVARRGERVSTRWVVTSTLYTNENVNGNLRYRLVKETKNK
jgi:hypothetical protein